MKIIERLGFGFDSPVEMPTSPILCCNFQLTENLKVGKPAYVTFSFTNPIKKVLTKCSINYEGPFLARFSTIKHK
jgi:hypothetical protein